MVEHPPIKTADNKVKISFDFFMRTPIHLKTYIIILVLSPKNNQREITKSKNHY
tara:strand:+ start:486 stop:647 length:162 start_codon:yes stop_codon:yes gene_type:complete